MKLEEIKRILEKQIEHEGTLVRRGACIDYECILLAVSVDATTRFCVPHNALAPCLAIISAEHEIEVRQAASDRRKIEGLFAEIKNAAT